ncbi:hypothetical protein H0H93_005620 [Arthromyces matolae]|nr:hypothetical protein H0H93_005620 [Arthromyces matolae]
MAPYRIDGEKPKIKAAIHSNQACTGNVDTRHPCTVSPRSLTASQVFPSKISVNEQRSLTPTSYMLRPSDAIPIAQSTTWQHEYEPSVFEPALTANATTTGTFSASKHSVVSSSSTDQHNDNIYIQPADGEGRRDYLNPYENDIGDNLPRREGYDPSPANFREEPSTETHFVIVPDPCGDPKRNIFLVYNTGSRELQLKEAIRQTHTWLKYAWRKFSGLIYLEDASTSSPTKLGQTTIDMLDQCVESQNIVVATMGWEDDSDPEPLKRRHKELLEQWRPYVDRGVNVLRLPAFKKSSRDACHTSWDIVRLIISKSEKGTTNERRRNMWKGVQATSTDTFLEDPRDTDVVILVMGPTGVGKSTVRDPCIINTLKMTLSHSQFVNYVVDGNNMEVGRNPESCTKYLQHVVFPHPGDPTRRIIVVDTPGFNDTYTSDYEILRRIAVWLARSYSANMCLAGVVYLHDITAPRMLGSAKNNLVMLQKVIGTEATQNILFITTKWSRVDENMGVHREEQLRDRHWKDILDLKADMRRFTDSHESGRAIIQHIIDKADESSAIDFVAIQNELVEVKKTLPHTEAGQTLLYTLEELLQIQQQASAQLRKEGNSTEVKALMQENGKKIRTTLEQINNLTGASSGRLRAFFKRAL